LSKLDLSIDPLLLLDVLSLNSVVFLQLDLVKSFLFSFSLVGQLLELLLVMVDWFLVLLDFLGKILFVSSKILFLFLKVSNSVFLKLSLLSDSLLLSLNLEFSLGSLFSCMPSFEELSLCLGNLLIMFQEHFLFVS
jgi:hypothetical protein